MMGTESKEATGVKSVENLLSKENTVKKFFNKIQRIGMAISAHDEYWVCSRGTGKSEGLDARFIVRNVWSMPGSLGALISPSYAKAWGNTLPAILHALAQWGYVEGIHYFVGRKAPKSAGFKQPKRPPLRDAWGNCIHFWNGTVMVVLSFSNGMSANSMSLDWVLGPEAKFLDYDKIKTEVNPANRGNRQYFDYSPWHHSVMYTTDMPNTKKGRWILDKREEMNPVHVQLIRNLYYKLKTTERLPEQNAWTNRVIKETRRDLGLARKFQRPVKPVKGKDREYAVFYGEYDIFDNLEVVGKDFIWQMYRDSPALVWRTAFLNERLFRVADCFYSSLDEVRHFTTPPESRYMEGMGNDWNRLQTCGCLADGDLNFDDPILIAFDSNSAISTACVGQVQNHSMRTLKSFFVKTPSKLDDLVRQVCEYYSPKLRKEIVFFYDHTFTWTTGNNAESYRDTIIRILEEYRWSVTDVYIGQAPRHDWKHVMINRGLNGDDSLLSPTFNPYHNEFLKLAMEQTGVKQGKNGFEKDKRPEALEDSPESPDEYKTHVTDAWDTLYVGANYHMPAGSSAGSGIAFLDHT